MAELWRPLEAILLSGGDSRLELGPRTDFNRYGTTPRPRSEAVHFSSSTALSISDYGFMFCDVLRRDLIAATLREGAAASGLRSRASDAVGVIIAEMLDLNERLADVVLAPSGTDTELLSVLVSLGKDSRSSIFCWHPTRQVAACGTRARASISTPSPDRGPDQERAGGLAASFDQHGRSPHSRPARLATWARVNNPRIARVGRSRARAGSTRFAGLARHLQDQSQHLSGAMHWCTFRARSRFR
jgi:hypothetical protein